jgi:hypothetical protein
MLHKGCERKRSLKRKEKKMMAVILEGLGDKTN